MTILLLAFTTLFLAVFSLCLVAMHKWEQAKELGAYRRRQEAAAEADREAAWHRNKHTIMG